MTTPLERMRHRLYARGLDTDGVGIKAVPTDSMAIATQFADDLDGVEFPITAVANTAAIDMDDEVVVPEGADTTYFSKNRTILYNHDSDLPIGSLVWMKFDDVKRKWVVRFNLGKATQLQRDIRALIREGVIRGLSIGFLATDWGKPTPAEVATHGVHKSIVREWKWMELSVTALPCNVEAVVASAGKGLIGKKSCSLLVPDGSVSLDIDTGIKPKRTGMNLVLD